MKMTFSKVTQWMAKNRPLVTLKQSGVLNTVRTKCQHRRLRTEKKTCEVIVCIFRPIIKLYYYFEFTSLHSPPPSIFLEKVFFVNSSIRIIILHTYTLRLLNICICDVVVVYSDISHIWSTFQKVARIILLFDPPLTLI